MPNNKNAITAQFEHFHLIGTPSGKAGYYKLTAFNILTAKFDSIEVFGNLPESPKMLTREFGDIISVGICYCSQTFQEFCEYLCFDLATEAKEALSAYEETQDKGRFSFAVVGSHSEISEISEEIELFS